MYKILKDIHDSSTKRLPLGTTGSKTKAKI